MIGGDLSAGLRQLHEALTEVRGEHREAVIRGLVTVLLASGQEEAASRVADWMVDELVPGEWW